MQAIVSLIFERNLQSQKKRIKWFTVVVENALSVFVKQITETYALEFQRLNAEIDRVSVVGECMEIHAGRAGATNNSQSTTTDRPTPPDPASGQWA